MANNSQSFNIKQKLLMGNTVLPAQGLNLINIQHFLKQNTALGKATSVNSYSIMLFFQTTSHKPRVKL